MVRQAMLLAHVVLELAEAAGEGDLLSGRERLGAKAHDLVLEERVPNPGKCSVVQCSRKIDAGHFRAELLAGFANGNHG